MPRKPPPAIEEDEGPSKEWMESYADAMTLLLAFFIMMFAFALVDETKFFDFKVGMVTALGVSDLTSDNTESLLGQGIGLAPSVGQAAVPTEDIMDNHDAALAEVIEAGTVTSENAEEVRDTIEEQFDELGAEDYVEVALDERGVVIRFDDRILFDSGSADFGVDAPVVLDVVAEVVQTIDNAIEIEGHTDDVPISTVRYPTNWELSGARASSVVRYLFDNHPIPPSRMAAVGLADSRPRENNSTEDGRQANRRVELVIRVEGMVDAGLGIEDPTGLGIDDAPNDPIALAPATNQQQNTQSREEENGDG